VADRIVVTGANGFVGAALCRRLRDSGFLVRGAVRDPAKPVPLPGIEWVALHDQSNGEETRQQLQGVKVIVHLAARVHVMRDAAADPLGEFRKVNVVWTERLARAAAAEQVRRFVYLSSIKVNGEYSVSPFTEQDPPNPQDPYGVSKWEAEQALATVSSQTGLETVVVRSPLVYGPGVRGNFLALLKLVRREIPLPLAAVRNKRSLIYRDNLADALVACVRDARASGHTYLISDGEDLSTPDLIRRIARTMGLSVRLWPTPVSLLRFFGALVGRQSVVGRLTDNLQIDASKLHRELGWSPPWSVDRGLEDTVAWFMNRRTVKPHGE
jgi:nucleoside-diphosphate-sugar epimerase